MTVYIALVTLGCHNIVSYNRNFSSCQFKEAGWNAVETHKSVTVSRSHLKHFEVSVSQSEKSKCLGLEERNACASPSRSYYSESVMRTVILPTWSSAGHSLKNKRKTVQRSIVIYIDAIIAYFSLIFMVYFQI